MFRFQQYDSIHFVHDKVAALNLFNENPFIGEAAIATHYRHRHYPVFYFYF